MKVDTFKEMDAVLFSEINKTLDKIHQETIREILTLDYVMKVMSPTASIHDAIQLKLTSEQIFTLAGLLKKLLNQIPIDDDILQRVTKPPKDFKFDPNVSMSSVDGLKMSFFSISGLNDSEQQKKKKSGNNLNPDFIGNFI